MKVAIASTAFVLAQVVTVACAATVGDSEPFLDLLRATRFIEQYKETAAVSARIYAARGQGSDKEFAMFMAKMAQSDLSDVESCMARSYAAGPLTTSDAQELATAFRSPIGVKVLAVSLRWQTANIERGSVQPMDASHLSDGERLELAELHRKPAFARYNTMATSASTAAATRTCLAASKVAKGTGIKF